MRAWTPLCLVGALSEADALPFEHLDKGAVVQNVRLFSAPKVKSRDAYLLLTQLLYVLVAKGDVFTPDEATNVFFAVTKLFQSKDVRARAPVRACLTR